jgi:hypothetical protein
VNYVDADRDEPTAEFLIQHHPLEDVLAFINARDDVRRIPAFAVTPAEIAFFTEPTTTRPTLPVAAYVEPDPFPSFSCNFELQLQPESAA